MSFYVKFNLLKIVIKLFIKFMKLVLKEISSLEFNFFSNLFYLTRIKLGLKDNFYNFIHILNL